MLTYKNKNLPAFEDELTYPPAIHLIRWARGLYISLKFVFFCSINPGQKPSCLSRRCNSKIISQIFVANPITGMGRDSEKKEKVVNNCVTGRAGDRTLVDNNANQHQSQAGFCGASEQQIFVFRRTTASTQGGRQK
jgi:hypothetical protein